MGKHEAYFCYLRITWELWLLYSGIVKELTCYADADGNMAEDLHAISGSAFYFMTGPFPGLLNIRNYFTLNN